MKTIKIIITILFMSILQADVKIINKNVFLSGNKLQVIKNNFILVSVREKNSDGRYYFVDIDGTVVYSGIISSGSFNYKTPSGIYKIYHKKLKWMSTKYPDPSGLNNMNYSLFFHKGFALHQGNPNYMSHGCVHLSKKDAQMMFRYLKKGDTVIITRDSYIKFLSKIEKQYLLKN